MIRLTIRTQIILACLAAILPLAAVEAYYLLDHYASARRQAIADARETAEAIASAGAAFMVDLQNSAQVVAQEAALAGGDPRRVQPLLERLFRETRTDAYVAFILPDGRIGASVPQGLMASGLNFGDRPFFQALRTGDEWRAINLTQSPVRGIPVWGVAAAARANGRFLGAVDVSVPATAFHHIIPVHMPAGSWSIVDGRGRLVYLNKVESIPWEKRDRTDRELIRRALAGGEATSEEFSDRDGVARLGASVPIRPFGWAVEVSRPLPEVLADARRQGWIEGSKYIPALAIAILIAIMIGNRVGLPLARLTVAADRIARGEFEAATEPGGPVEVARLTAAFNAMATNLRRRQRWDQAPMTIGRTATSHLPLNEILMAGLEAIMEASEATIGLVRLLDPKTKDLVLAAHRDLPPAYVATRERIPWGAKLAGYVAFTGEPWLVGRLQDQPDVSHLSLLADQVRSLICLPLKAHERVVGTITLGHGQPDFFGPADLSVLLPAVSMLAGAILAEQLHEATAKEAEERALLFRELDHRVRNNLAALISLLHLGAEEAEGSAAESLRDMAERVTRLAEVHNLLSGRGLQLIEIRELAEVVARNVLAALEGDVQIQWKVIGVPVRVTASKVTAIALVLNELLTNCAKHAFPVRPTGSVTIQVVRDHDQVGLDIWDNGVGLDLGRRPLGLGLTIVETLVRHNLRGSVRFVREEGTLVSIRFPESVEIPGGGVA